MALYYTLAVLNANNKLLKRVFSVSQLFAREYKHAIGQYVKSQGVRLKKIFIAVNLSNKLSESLLASSRFEKVMLKTQRI
jgi:hypothetical protein